MKTVEEKFKTTKTVGCAKYDAEQDMWMLLGPFMTTEDGKCIFITREMMDDAVEASL
jgi:hypothetical protein